MRLQEETETECVKRLTNLPESHFLDERYRLTEPLSPHASAAIDDVSISLSDFQLPAVKTNHLVVEGAGGLMVPLNDKYMIIDLIEYFSLPALLVAGSELGTLNHTFLSLEALRSRNIPVLGVVMNGPQNESNRIAIETYGNVNVLAEIGPQESLNSQVLQQLFENFK
ncbi:MAG: dethiobiotin synthase [Balneolaceae bacterium]|nr:dethiobiotin synthase [Balneolaceae bacterium]